MKYNDFKNSYQNTPVINISSLMLGESDSKSLRDNINKWTKKGYTYRLKNDLYALNDNDRRAELSRFFIANYIYTPSYVSLEYAMFHYGLIPETVYEITSVTTSKTNKFENHFGIFSYSSVQKNLFFGYTAKKDEHGMPLIIASPEKAYLDFLYLRFCRRKGSEDVGSFVKKNRVQNLKLLDKTKYQEYLLKYPTVYHADLKLAFTKGEK